MHKTTGLTVGEEFPDGVTFTYIPWTTNDTMVCGIPITYETSEEFRNKRIVLLSLPGAFTPTCSGVHVPSFVANIPELKAKGVDQLLIIGLHDAYVMSGWQKVNSAASPSDNAFVLFMSDLGTRLAHKIGWTAPGDRSGRWVSIIDHGKIRYAKCEPNLWDVTVSSIEAVLEHL